MAGKKKSAASLTLERAIHFYRVDIDGERNGQFAPFDPSPALAAIRGMPYADGADSRYLPDDDGNAICAWPEMNGAVPALRFGQIRRMGLPQLEQAGAVSDLNIAADSGLVEMIHVMFFPGNIVGADFNFYGPRLSRLGIYLHSKSNKMVPLSSFHPLLRRDVTEQLNHLTEIRFFNLRIIKSYIDFVHQADQSLGDAFIANAQVLDGHAEEFEIILRPSKTGRYSALKRLIGPIRTLVCGSDLRDSAKCFQVSGKHNETGKVEKIDLLRDHLIARKQILRLGERSRAVNPDSAFDVITKAYDELKEDLHQAASFIP
jgi:hypothetical protein